MMLGATPVSGSWLARVVVGALWIAGVTACAADSAVPSSAATTNMATPTALETEAVGSASEPAQGESIDIGGRTLYLECQGSGAPTVILEAGMTGDHRTWERVQPQIAQSTRVCAYDRANVPPSDPAPPPRTAGDAVDDLQLLLERAEIERPVVLVGFSMGGLIAQLYAATYPADVAGLVLIESNHPDEWDQFEVHLTPEQIEEDRAMTLANPEGLDPYRSLEEAQAAGPLPKVPLVVVTAGMSEGWPPGWDPELFDALRAEQQADLATRIPGGWQVIAEGSGHHVPSQQPTMILEAVESVLADLP